MLETISATQHGKIVTATLNTHMWGWGGGGVIDHGQEVGHVLVANQITKEHNMNSSETHEKRVDAQYNSGWRRVCGSTKPFNSQQE